MEKFVVFINILGLMIALVGVFVEPTWARFVVVGLGTLLSSVRIGY